MMIPDWLARAAARCAEETWSMGYVLERYRHSEEKSREQLSEELGCATAQLNWLALCGRPRPERFAEHVSTLAARVGAAPAKLAAIIRRVEVLETLSGFATEAKGDANKIITLAARDRSEKEDPGDE